MQMIQGCQSGAKCCFGNGKDYLLGALCYVFDLQIFQLSDLIRRQKSFYLQGAILESVSLGILIIQADFDIGIGYSGTVPQGKVVISRASRGIVMP